MNVKNCIINNTKNLISFQGHALENIKTEIKITNGPELPWEKVTNGIALAVGWKEVETRKTLDQYMSISYTSNTLLDKTPIPIFFLSIVNIQTSM